MVVFYIVIVIIALVGVRKRTDGVSLYLSKESTNAIKGVFILVVFMRHVVPYVMKAGYEMNTWLDKSFCIIDGQIGQLLVVMFLFYSGYGVMESIKKKGEEYVRNIPKHRLLTTFLNFDLAVGLFLLLDFALGIEVSTEQYFLSRIGWDSVGNSNWYVFVILLLYLLTYFCFRLSHKRGVIILIGMSLVTVLVLLFFKQSWWYNTLLCYPAGMIFSSYREKCCSLVKSKYFFYFITTLLVFIFLHGLNLMNHILPRYVCAFTYNLESIVFAFLIVIITMKIHVGNRLLVWLGANLFPLYIYQRMPMVAFRELLGAEWLSIHPYLFVVFCLIISLLITYLYRFWIIEL